VDRGFTRTDRMHLQAHTSDISFWVDTGPLESRKDISPFVGLRSEMVEGLRAKLLSRPFDPAVGTVGANVGYVLDGTYRRWAPPSTAAEVVLAIDQALSKLRNHASLEMFEKLWVIPGSDAPGWWIAALATEIHLGHRERALALLDEAEARECAYEDELCEQYRGVRAIALPYINEIGV